MNILCTCVYPYSQSQYMLYTSNIVELKLIHITRFQLFYLTIIVQTSATCTYLNECVCACLGKTHKKCIMPVSGSFFLVFFVVK